MKKSLLLAAFFSILLISCKTTDAVLVIPGEKATVITNIYSEYVNIADQYFTLEKYDNAIKYYKMALNSKNNFNSTYYKLAKAYVMSSKWTEAEIMYESLLKSDPSNDSLKESLAYIYAMNSDSNKAISLYDELISTNPDIQSFYENKLSVQLLNCETLEDLEKAESTFNYLDEKFSDSKNIPKFQKELDEMAKKIKPPVENPQEVSSDTSDSNSKLNVSESKELEEIL